MADSSKTQNRRARFLLWLAVISLLAVGCGKSKIGEVEQKALERHHQEVLLRRAIKGEIMGPDGERLFKALRFLSVIDRNDQLPGPTSGDRPRLTSVRGEVTANGPYFFTQEFQIATLHSQSYGYVLTQTYSNGDFQLEKAWHADASGKVVKEYPIKPPRPMISSRAIYLGPNNPGAERGLNGWFYGTLGGGLVARDATDPATGLNCFKVGITNDIPGQTNHADLRSEIFLLGPAARGRQPVTLSFTYKLPEKINPGDRLQVLFRFYDESTNFLDQDTIDLGTNREDAQMTHYKTITMSDLIAPAKAAAADLVVAANINEAWTSGAGQFDDFAVVTIPPRSRTTIIIVGFGIAAVLAVSFVLTFFKRRWVTAWMLGLFIHLPVPARSQTKVLPQTSLAAHYFGNDASWFEKNIPFFDCSDPEITRIYYYRWKLYKAHLKDLGARGYIVTEFLDDVGWTFNAFQSLNDATAFHIDEGRWLKNNRYLDDYIYFMYSGGNDRHFSEAIAAAVYGRYLVNGDRSFAIKNLGSMKGIYDLWTDHYDSSKGLYFIAPILDATEYSIASIDATGGKDGFLNGDAFRPTINSYMFANAQAISKLARLAGDTNTADIFEAKAASLKSEVETNLWNDGMQHFIDRFKVDNRFAHYWDFIRGRELAGYAPWAFELPDHDPKYNASWKHLLSAQELGGPYGLRTVEPSYQYYMRQYRYATVDGKRLPECQWNGPSWPFQTTLALQGMANLLNDYTQDEVTADDYGRLLRQYTHQHYLNGDPDLQEDYNPDTGNVIVGLPRSNHYNHSCYNDLIITGLAGLRPRADNVLEINPLVPHSIAYFCLEGVSYHGKLLTIVYDRDGKHYKKGAGLSVSVNGRRILTQTALGKATVAISEPTTSATPHPVDLAVNYIKKGYPRPFASINTSTNELYQAVDGRIWFYPKVRNYWSNAGSKTDEDWFSLDFGGGKQFSSVQLYFYADDAKFRAPTKYVIQYWTGRDWANVQEPRPTPKKPWANGENTANFRPVNTSKLRLLFTNPKAAALALVEVKAFE